MRKICCTVLLIGLCSSSSMGAAQDSAKKLTKAAVEEAARDLRGVEIALWDHSGIKAEGSSTAIRGDGTVVQTWSAYFPLTPEEKTTTRTLRLPLDPDDVRKIVRLFASDDVLTQPRTRTDLVGVREMRYTVALTVSGAGSFEGEHPNLEWSKLPQTPAVRTLLQTIRDSVKALQEKIDRQDAEFLSKDRMLQLADGFVLELHDVHALWGGTSVRVRADGGVEGLFVDRGVQRRHFTGTVEKTRAAAILRSAAELGTFDLRSKRHGIPDEARPVLVVNATVRGATYSRWVAMWEGEIRERPAFQQVRKALEAIAADQLKK